MISRRAAAIAAPILALLAHSASASAQDVVDQPRVVEPWSDADPATEPNRYRLGDFGFRAGAEYRAQAIYVNPISLGTETDRRISWLEHRLRLDATADYLDKIRIVTSTDVLNGVLWGDNGDYLGTPSSNSGTNVATKNPNDASACVGLRSGDPLQSSSYGYTLCPAQPVTIRRAYGEVVLPFGLLRVGRQPVNIGTGVQAADGDGRPNRFGVSGTGNLVDRVLFATKPLEAMKPETQRNLSANEGLILALAYDRLVTDSPQLFDDDVHQVDVAFRYLAPKHALGRDLLVAGYYVHRWDKQFGTAINSTGLRAMSRFGDFYAGFDAAMNLGTTREISQAFGLITGDPTVDQTIRQFGGRAVIRYDKPMWTAYLESDFASGNPDPRARQPLTQFVFAEDANVGLLLFKQVLAFQTARSAAAGVAVLQRLGATTFPAQSIATNGAFTDGVTLFPQFDLHPVKDILLRGGVLFAWAPSGVVDPIASLQRKNGLTGQNAFVNFAGGKPGSYYGTELDGRFQWRFIEHFAFDLEGAVLFPGSALQNQDGYAVRSVLVQGRTTFFF